MGEIWKSPCGMMELRCGDWREVLADVERCDALITDPPYSDRTHRGQRTGSRDPAYANSNGSAGGKTTISYSSLDNSQAERLALFANLAKPCWVAVFSDHAGAVLWESSFSNRGLYVFAPVVWLRESSTPRLSGDGPTSSCEYITVARPRHRLREGDSGSRPGFYLFPGNNTRVGVAGSKPLPLMRSIVRDYSRPGDLIVDPYAGGGTTLLAAAIEGRRAIGAELDPETFRKAVRRLSAGYTPAIPTTRSKPPKQTTLVGV